MFDITRRIRSRYLIKSFGNGEKLILGKNEIDIIVCSAFMFINEEERSVCNWWLWYSNKIDKKNYGLWYVTIFFKLGNWAKKFIVPGFCRYFDFCDFLLLTSCFLLIFFNSSDMKTERQKCRSQIGVNRHYLIDRVDVFEESCLQFLYL